MKILPRITVVTPSYNQGAFLADTIESVLGQGYPNLEYFVMDGGSTDNSVEVIKKYEKHLAFWCSQSDGGQAAAINAGFQRATGQILAWLNSDDFYLPGTLRYVSEELDADQEELLAGNCFHFVEGTNRASGSLVPLWHGKVKLALRDYLIQPSSFWTKKLWDKTGPLETHWSYVFDWDWYIRAQQNSAKLKITSRYLAAYRIHPQHKTGTGGEKRLQEIRDIYEKHSSPRIVRLYETCRKNHLLFKKIKKRSKGYKLTKLVDGNRILKILFPTELRDMSPEEIENMLDVLG